MAVRNHTGAALGYWMQSRFMDFWICCRFFLFLISCREIFLVTDANSHAQNILGSLVWYKIFWVIGSLVWYNNAPLTCVDSPCIARCVWYNCVVGRGTIMESTLCGTIVCWDVVQWGAYINLFCLLSPGRTIGAWGDPGWEP